MQWRAVMVLLIVACTGVTAQQQVPNSDLEDWTLFAGSGTFKDYEEPSGGWTSGNGVIHVAPGADPVLEKSTDMISGDYCAKLVTRRIFGQIASGSLYTGTFKLNLGDPSKSAQRGIPFTARPLQFRFWYRYLPQGSDSATMYARLSKWNGTEREAIAEARLLRFEPQPEWTEAIIPFLYDSEKMPDTIAVVFASSAGGEFFRGDIGSTLYVDNIGMIYDPVSVQEDHIGTAPFIVDGTALRLDPSLSYTGIDVYSMQGACVSHVEHGNTVDMSHVSAGVYAVVIRSHVETMTWTISVVR